MELFSAHAEVIPFTAITRASAKALLRACGGNSGGGARGCLIVGSSPRMRR